jgi:hypothetical protein
LTPISLKIARNRIRTTSSSPTPAIAKATASVTRGQHATDFGPKPSKNIRVTRGNVALRLLQICLVYINTLMIQRVLTAPDWTQRMLPDDLRALTPLIYAHVTPSGTFRLEMSQRLAIEQDAVDA